MCPELKRVADLEEGDEMRRVQLLIPPEWFDKIGKLALEKKMSKGAIFREAMRDWFKKREKSIEQNPEATIKDEDLNKILGYCSTFWGGFEIDGSEGFITIMANNDFKLRDLTPEQWERIQEKLAIGCAGYLNTPTPEEFTGKFEILEPSEEQLEWLSNREMEVNNQ